jgi:hypothetical protein
MSDMDSLAEGSAQSQDMSASSVPAPPPTPAPSNPQPSEQEGKTWTDKEVNDLVAQKIARERAKHERELQYSRAQMPEPPRTESPQTMGGMQQMTPEDIGRIIDQRAEQWRRDAVAQQVVSEFINKLQAGKDKYPDFEDVITDLNLPVMTDLVHLSNSVDNTADVIYDLGKNPHKVGNLMALINNAPHLAQIEMQKLSNSIKGNVVAQNTTNAKEPLSQIKSSTVGADNGSSSISDLRKQSWLRG